MRDSQSLITLYNITMSCTKTYKVTLTVTTASSPKDILEFIQKRIKNALPVFRLDYELVDERPTDIEHHGGVVDDDKE